jgi:hypothetical protein
MISSRVERVGDQGKEIVFAQYPTLVSEMAHTLALRGWLVVRAISPRILPLREPGHRPCFCALAHHHFHFPAADEIRAISQVSLLEDHLAGMEGLIIEQGVAAKELPRQHSKQDRQGENDS